MSLSVVAQEARSEPVDFDANSYVRRATRRNDQKSWKSSLNDGYITALTLGTAFLYAWSLLSLIKAEVAGTAFDAALPGAGVLPGSAALGLVLVCSAAALLKAATILGPIGLSGPEATWLLPLPVHRWRVLRGRYARMLLAFALTAGFVFLPIALLLPGPASPGAILLSVSTAALIGLLAALVAAALQLTGKKWVASCVFEVCILAGPLLTTFLAMGYAPTSIWGTFDILLAFLPPMWPVFVLSGSHEFVYLILILCAVMVAAVTPLLGRLRDGELISSGAVAGHLGASAYLMDSTEFGRALDLRQGNTKRWTMAFLRVPSARALFLRAETLTLLRAPGKLFRIVSLWFIPSAVLIAAGTATGLMGSLGVIASALGAMGVAGYAGRVSAEVPGLEHLLPLSARSLHRMKLVVPSIVMLAWVLPTFYLAASITDNASLILMAVIAVPGLGASIVRRNSPSGKKSGAGHDGALAQSIVSSYTRGIDSAIVVLIPVLAGLISGAVTVALVIFQCITVAACVWWCMRLPARDVRYEDLV